MKYYKAYNFELSDVSTMRDVYIALLSEAGFEGFAETEKGFLAYTNHEIAVEEVLSLFEGQYAFSTEEVEEENWNKSWEKQIKPLVIDNQIYIKTSFHPEKDIPTVITIDPKMSFGTGHHETTYLMIKQMMQMNFAGKSVLDMGAGTGVLSILAKKMGADSVYAVDNDKWAYENMLENFDKNNAKDVQSFLGDASILKDFPRFDIVLANINRNILLADIQYYTQKIKPNGNLVLSGFYREDIPLIETETKKYGMVFEREMEKNNWMSLQFKKM